MRNFFKKLALFSFLLALSSTVIAFVYFERTKFSEEDIRIEINAPEDIVVGEEVVYELKYRNNSDTRLENVSLVFEYPETAVPINDQEDVRVVRDTLRAEKQIDDIYPGEERIVEFKTLVFGAEGDRVEASATFNYSPRGLTANYDLGRSHTARISENPLVFELDFPENINPDEEFSFLIRYFSDMEVDLEDVLIKMDYPSDFEFLRSIPGGIGENEWERDILGSKEGGLIEVVGKIDGSPGDIKRVSAEIGIWQYDRFITLKEIDSDILIPQPNLFVDILVNDSTSYVANPGEDLLYEIYFKNVGDDVLEDLFLTVDLDRDLLDMDEIEPMEGRFQPSAGSIIWSHSSVSRLRRLAPGDEEKISFWGAVKERGLPGNPEIRVGANLSGTEREVRTKVNAVPGISQSFVGLEDPLNSEGPLPLELNRPANYTVFWELESSYNNFRDVKVKAILSEEASLTEKSYPEDSDLIYDSSTGEIVWKMEELKRKAELNKEDSKVYFQVEIIPFSVDPEMELVSEVELVLTDDWTDQEIVKKADPLIYEDLLNAFNIDIEDEVEEIEFENEEE